jgi:hypothetical protein
MATMTLLARLAVWSVGVTAYVVAVLQRTSLGVSGLDATRRFDASSVLASFAVLQLLVYAACRCLSGCSSTASGRAA